MKELLKIEWMKIKNYKAFLIIFIFLILGIFAANFIVYKIFKSIVEETQAGALVKGFNIYDFNHVWEVSSYVSGYLLILPSMLIVFLTTNEFSFRTNRQNIIDGWSRKQFFDVKVALAFLIALVSTVMVIITALIFGFTGDAGFSFTGISHIAFFFIKAFSYNMIALLLAVLIRKTGFAIGMFFIYLFAENFIAQLLDFWSMQLLNNNIDIGSMGSYLPMNASDGLLTFPDNPLQKTAIFPSNYTGLVLTFAIGYLTLFYFWTRKKLMKADL
jgi:ABC-2 type transport system permease protein